MNCLFYLFGFLPSLIWLSFYLRKDVHPESDWEVTKVFFFGMLVAFPILLIELGMESISPNIIFCIFIGGAFVEEFLKYLVVKLEIMRNSELDEPCDLIFYMIIAALGFAAVENILSLRAGNAEEILNLDSAIGITSVRFITATFLHTISSGILGYFMALSFYNYKKRIMYFLSGLTIAVVLHGLYNLSMKEISGWQKFILPLIIFIAAGTFLFLAIKKIKKIKGICNH